MSAEDTSVAAVGPTGEAAPESLRRAAASGALWQALAYVSGKVVVAVTTVILARLLEPREFGLVALAAVFLTFADVVSDGGVAQALVFLKRSASVVRAATLCAVVSGLGLTGAALAAAPAIAAYFGEPAVVSLVRLLAVSLTLTALSAIPESLLRRDLLFRRLALAAAGRALVVGVVSVGLALAGYGAWSLVWGTVAGAFCYLVATTVLLPQRPDLRWWRARRPELRAVLGYGIPAAGGILLSKLIFDIDYLVVGRRLGSEALGLYTLAFRLPELAIINVFFVISSVTFPLYSRARSDPPRLRRGYLTSMRVQAMYGLTAGTGIAVTAPVLVPVVLGERWHRAIAPLVALGVYAALRSLGAGANDVYKALGRPGLSVWVSLVRLAILLPALVLAAGWGIVGVAWAQAGAAAVFVVLMQTLALRVLRLGWRDFVSAVAPAVAVAAAVGVVAAAVVAWCPGADWQVLLVAVGSGGAVALVAGRWTVPGLLDDLLAGLRRRRV